MLAETKFIHMTPLSFFGSYTSGIEERTQASQEIYKISPPFRFATGGNRENGLEIILLVGRGRLSYRSTQTKSSLEDHARQQLSFMNQPATGAFNLR